MSDPAPATTPNAPAPAAAGSPPAAAPAFVIPKEFKDKITVNGQERELSYEEIKQRAMKADGAEERFKQANSVLEAVRKNPLAVLNNPALGLDVKRLAIEQLKSLKNISEEDKKELSTWFYERIVKPAQMPAAEREAMEWKSKAELLEAQANERSERERQDREQVETKQEFHRILAEISAAIPNSGLPFSAELKSPNDADLVRRIGKKMQIALHQSKNLSVADAITMVKADLRAEHNAMAKLFNDDNLGEFYDAEVMEKFNRAMLKKFKTVEKEKEKAARAKESDEPQVPRSDRTVTRAAARNADKLIRKISTGRF